MHFVVTAMDYTDPEALERRMTHREAHLAGVRTMIANGHIINGGAILDDHGKMTGSTLYVDFPDRETLEKHLQNDPYVTGKVWEHIDIRPVKLVPM